MFSLQSPLTLFSRIKDRMGGGRLLIVFRHIFGELPGRFCSSESWIFSPPSLISFHFYWLDNWHWLNIHI